MATSNRIKCRYCSWATVKWSGKTSSPAKAFARLARHIDEAHSDAADRLEEAREFERERVDAIVGQLSEITQTEG